MLSCYLMNELFADADEIGTDVAALAAEVESSAAVDSVGVCEAVGGSVVVGVVNVGAEALLAEFVSCAELVAVADEIGTDVAALAAEVESSAAVDSVGVCEAVGGSVIVGVVYDGAEAVPAEFVSCAELFADADEIGTDVAALAAEVESSAAVDSVGVCEAVGGSVVVGVVNVGAEALLAEFVSCAELVAAADEIGTDVAALAAEVESSAAVDSVGVCEAVGGSVIVGVVYDGAEAVPAEFVSCAELFADADEIGTDVAALAVEV
ncbi:hypothetical protein ECG_00002 [Echinococcus granulosus]|nr:hypothetical protein ECG_00002 [Echinococcus granulosus]